MVHNTEEISITTVHEGEKVHKCSVCDKSFASSKHVYVYDLCDETLSH